LTRAETPAASAPRVALGPADTYFVTQTSLGTPFQVDSGRLAQTKGTFDTDYIRSQVSYQRANAALYQYEIANGTDPDLRTFAQETLPKIQDHLTRALKLEGAAE
jgi:predicted outer membrane protein